MLWLMKSTWLSPVATSLKIPSPAFFFSQELKKAMQANIAQQTATVDFIAMPDLFGKRLFRFAFFIL